jgi:hypothetical protein
MKNKETLPKGWKKDCDNDCKYEIGTDFYIFVGHEEDPKENTYAYLTCIGLENIIDVERWKLKQKTLEGKLKYAQKVCKKYLKKIYDGIEEF